MVSFALVCRQVDTVKRLLIKELPPVLAIQLKRFDYDWERECAIKFNDYFEFPRELDMEPYTVAGVAKLEDDEGSAGEPGHRWELRSEAQLALPARGCSGALGAG